MRGVAERLNLKIVKEFFFCYKERNFQMMRSNLHYELTDDDLMEYIRDYIQSRRDSFHGVVFEDIAEVFQALNKSEENTKTSEFPDFVCENGFIEHFEITSSNETRKGSTKKIDQFLFNKDIITKIEENTMSNSGEIIELLNVLYMRHLENYELLSKIDKKLFPTIEELNLRRKGYNSEQVEYMKSDSELRKRLESISDKYRTQLS